MNKTFPFLVFDVETHLLVVVFSVLILSSILLVPSNVALLSLVFSWSLVESVITSYRSIQDGRMLNRLAEKINNVLRLESKSSATYSASAIKI